MFEKQILSKRTLPTLVVKMSKDSQRILNSNFQKKMQVQFFFFSIFNKRSFLQWMRSERSQIPKNLSPFWFCSHHWEVLFSVTLPSRKNSPQKLSPFAKIQILKLLVLKSTKQNKIKPLELEKVRKVTWESDKASKHA